MPLPLTEELSSREREIALFASLGYSSRWIAEQFHLSVRTVDTHLRHVFTKLRVSGRDELRQWFRREHVSR
ncbi:LuxR family transcriptional regulator [Leucobacter muris]|jgi:DNA-binding CsgD family transcriptional regulator|uniref:LuxR family transcriptional regulator n=2 Tax=Leucobacter TaxID=55968 RepID=A0ABX5QJW8_9MICO|nr:LuxR family transcriptional regulator [Leucobacter muris]